MSFTVMPGGESDLAEVGSLHALSRMKTYKFIRGYQPEVYEAKWRARFEAEGQSHRLLVARADSGSMAGFAYVGDGWLYAIHVHPDWIGRGVGLALMTAARETLRGLGFERVALWVLEDNERARRFYERDGWRLSGQSRVDNMDGVDTRQVEYVCDLVKSTLSRRP